MRFIGQSIVAASLLTSSLSMAADKDEEWEFLVVFPMLWAPSITGTTGPANDKIDIDIPFDNIVSNLNFGLMGDFYAQKDRWLLGVRANYLHVKNDTDTQPGRFVPSFNVDLSAHMSLNDLFAGYEVTHGLVLLTGVRHVYSKIDVNVGANSDRPFWNDKNGTITSSSHQFDWLIGLKYAHQFGNNWGLSLTVDAGIAGDNDINRGLNLAGTYSFSKHNNLWFGYRYLNLQNTTDSTNGPVELDVTQKGPMIGWAYMF
ncbi:MULTISPECIES: hypothetical protein [Vibrio]|uniref:hypothetical protein n=1 Tax=Vibrio TaxID=662 RepID=UPI003D138EE3